MRVFLTGASGFIGSKLIPELLAAGHEVLGMVRSVAGAAVVASAGAVPFRGDLDDIASLRRGAAQADGVIHTAFVHDFSKFGESCETDRRAIEAFGSVLEGSDRPLIVTSGVALAQVAPGALASEDDAALPVAQMPRTASEEAAVVVAGRGVRAMIVRLPQVHDVEKQGLITYLADIARERGVCAYIGEGTQRWAAAHVSDVVRLYRLVLESGIAGRRYHAVAEEGVAMRAIAETLARRLGLPARSLDDAQGTKHFGALSMFVGRDLSATSVRTKAELGWNSTGATLLEDLTRLVSARTAH